MSVSPNPMQYGEGQVVAIRTEGDGDGGPQWMLARYLAAEGGRHRVEDLDSRQVLHVEGAHVRPFPDAELAVRKGEGLLSAWYNVEQQHWTTILYPCQALEDYPSAEEPESIVVRVLFEGDPTPYVINAQWAIRSPE